MFGRGEGGDGNKGGWQEGAGGKSKEILQENFRKGRMNHPGDEASGGGAGPRPGRTGLGATFPSFHSGPGG